MTDTPTGIGVLTLDRACRVQSWNRWLQTATGLDEAAVRGRAVAELAAEERGALLTDICVDVIAHGTTRVLAPAIHGCVIACPPLQPSRHFSSMQQRVTCAPLRGDTGVVGVMVTVEDVTTRLDTERDLVAQSGSPDWQTRRDAVRSLKASASPQQVAELIGNLERDHHDFSVLSGALAVLVAVNRGEIESVAQLLRDPSPNLRMHAALALGAIGNAAAAASLISALGDDDANVRFHAIEALGKLGVAEAVDPLSRVAVTGDFFLAFPAIDALARIRDPGVVPVLVSLLEQEMLRPAVIDALGELGDEDCVAPLMALLETDVADVGSVCAALERIALRYERTFGDGAVIADTVSRSLSATAASRVCEAVRARTLPRRAVVAVAAWLGVPALPALIAVLADPEVEDDARAAVGRAGRAAVALLVDAVRTGSRDTRIAAASLLGELGDRDATPALVEAAGSHDTELVIAAVSALAALSDPDSLEPAKELLAHPDVMVRQGALAVIHSIGGGHVHVYARDALHSPDSRVREMAVRIAGYFGFPDLVPGIRRALADPTEQVRRAAIEQIPLLDDASAVAALMTALRSETARNRAAAAHALRLVEAPGVAAALVEAMDDRDAWVRYFAASSLGVHGTGPAAIAALTRAVEEDGPPPARIAALNALTVLGAENLAALASVLASEADDSLAAAGIQALAGVGGIAADLRLQEALRDPRGTVRLAAASALTRRADAGAVAALEFAAHLDEPAELSGVAIEGLSSIASQAAPTVARVAVTTLVRLAAEPRHRDRTIGALGVLPPDRIGWLRELFDASSPDVRELLINAAARTHHAEATRVLAAALADPVTSVRLAAVGAIGRVGAPLARDSVVSLHRSDPNPAVRRLAAAVCRRHGWDGAPSADR